jgi:hypothetical protein
VRAGVLLLAAAVVVHQLVYGLAGVRADEHAHEYFGWLRPALAVLLVMAVAELVVRVLRVDRRPVRPPPRGRVLWPVSTLLLVAVFAGQEAAETALTAGEHHHALRELILEHGLWTVAPVSAFLGGAIALLLRGAAAVEAWTLAIEPLRSTPPTPFVAALPAARVHTAPRDVLGRNLAGRGPPLVVA